MVPAVGDEPQRTDHVHALIGVGPRLDLARREEGISAKNQRRADPADDVDEEERGQAARFRRTYWRMPPERKYSSSL
jgi:hypothetical protein